MITSKEKQKPVFVEVSGAVSTDPESGLIVDANRLLVDYRLLLQENQNLRIELSDHLYAVASDSIDLSQAPVDLVDQSLELFKLNFDEFKRENAVLIRELDDFALSSHGYKHTFLSQQTDHLKKILAFDIAKFQPSDDITEIAFDAPTLLDVVRRYYAIREGTSDSSSDFADQTDATALYLIKLANYGEVLARVSSWVHQNIGYPASSALALWNHGLQNGEAIVREGVWRKHVASSTPVNFAVNVVKKYEVGYTGEMIGGYTGASAEEAILACKDDMSVANYKPETSVKDRVAGLIAVEVTSAANSLSLDM